MWPRANDGGQHDALQHRWWRSALRDWTWTPTARMCETVTAGLLRLTRARRSPTRRPRPWQPCGGHVVIVAPHPDDETIGAGGTVALHKAAGDPVTVVVVTDGGRSRAHGLNGQEMVSRRRREVEAAAETLGVDRLVLLAAPERAINSVVSKRLGQELVDATIVYAPSTVDFHPDHLDVARAVASVIRPSQTVRMCELGVPLTPALVNVVADIGRIAARKDAALRHFMTQNRTLAPIKRLARYRSALYGVAPSEVFWEVQGDAYRRVVTTSDWGWRDTPFRGIRQHPCSDVLAFARGHQTRVRLAQVASIGSDLTP